MIIPLLTALVLALAPDEGVLEDARAALENLVEARARVERSVERVELEGRQMAELLVLTSGPLPPSPATVETYADQGADELKAHLEAWSTHRELLEQRVEVPRRAREREAEQGEVFARLGSETEALVQAAARAEASLAAVEGLVAEAEVSEQDAATALGLEQLSLGREQVDDARDLSAALPARIDAALEAEQVTLAGMEQILPPADELVAEATVQRDASEILMSIDVLERGQRDSLVAEGSSGLESALDRAMDDWSALADLEQLRLQAREQWEELQALDRTRAARTAPARDAFAESEGPAELREARGELAWAEALLAYRRETVELLKQSRARLEALRDQMVLGGQVVRDAGSALIRVRSVAQARAVLSDSGGTEPIEYATIDGVDAWEQLKAITVTEARRTYMQRELERRLEGTELEDAAARALEAQVESVDRARNALREEEAFAALIEEMGQLADTELLAELDPNGAPVAALRAARQEEQNRLQLVSRLEAQMPQLVLRVTSLDTPYAQHQITSHPGRGQEIRDELRDLAGRDQDLFPTDTSDLPQRWLDIRPETSRAVELDDEGPEEELLSPSKARLRALRVAQRAAQERLHYFQELDALVAELAAAREEYESRLDAAGEAMGDRLSRERRLYAAGREVRKRRESGSLPDARVPQNLVEPLSREEIAGLVEARKTSGRATDERRELLRIELERQGLFLSWKQWAELGGEVAQQNNNLISQPVSHVESARMSVTELKDFERGNLEFTAQQLGLEQRSRVERLLAPLAKPKRRERFEATLGAYYLELVNLGRVIEEYTKAQEAYRQLIEVNQRHREQLSGALEAMEEVGRTRLLEYQEVSAFAAIAAKPSRRIRITAEFSRLHKRDLPQLIDEGSWDPFFWADALMSAEARLWGDRAWIAELQRRLSREGIESEVNAFGSHIAHIGSEINEREALRSELDERIRELRSNYRRELQENALWTLFKVALIPLLAMLMVRGLSRLAGRMRTKARGEIGSPDRQRRLETLTNVTTASIRVVVWVIAAIYVLGFLGLDITPIIASASVVGLAVAFGAQRLVGDFFAGFFLLLEHQYSVGDVVDLGPAAGRVEHISLRMTTLRDLQGTVHYVPNGLVQRVANKTKGWSQIVMEVGFPYGEDIDRVTGILREELEALREDDDVGKLILEEPTVAGVQQLGESQIDLRVMVKVLPGEQWGVARELRRRIRRRFDAEGIRVPYPQRVIHQLGQGDESPKPT